MAQSTNDIRQDIDSLRGSMTHKMEQIEATVKGGVSDTIESVKRTFDIKEQVRTHPWAALGSAIVVGYMAGGLANPDDLPQSTSDFARSTSDFAPTTIAEQAQNTSEFVSGARQDMSRTQRPGIVNALKGQVSGEIHTLVAAAMSMGVAYLREMIRATLPKLSQEYEQARSRHGVKPAYTNNTNLRS